jgi:uncharacterized protein with HEPN domain
MERHDVRVHLRDTVTPADAVSAFLRGRSRDDHFSDLLRSAVARQLPLVGDAMARGLRAEPALRESLT